MLYFCQEKVGMNILEEAAGSKCELVCKTMYKDAEFFCVNCKNLNLIDVSNLD